MLREFREYLWAEAKGPHNICGVTGFWGTVRPWTPDLSLPITVPVRGSACSATHSSVTHITGPNPQAEKPMLLISLSPWAFVTVTGNRSAHLCLIHLVSEGCIRKQAWGSACGGKRTRLPGTVPGSPFPILRTDRWSCLLLHPAHLL